MGVVDALAHEEVRRRATRWADVKPTHGVLWVPRPPVSLRIGQPSVTAWVHLAEGIA